MDVPAPSRIPFNQRWQLHKAELEDLYLNSNLTVPQIMKHMREERDFDASETQYKYRFKQWGWKKKMSASKKGAVLDIIQRRAQLGKSTVATYQGKEIDSKKLRRQAKQIARDQRSLVAGVSGAAPRGTEGSPPNLFGGRIFMNWDIPYQTLVRQSPHSSNHPSPFGPTVSTPSDVSIASPAGDVPTSPGLSQALKQRISIKNAQLFIAGRHDELLRSLNMADKKCLATWLHEFWLFAFKTAKFWGRGPRAWNAHNLGFVVDPSVLSVLSPFSTTMNLSAAGSPMAVDTPESTNLEKPPGALLKPSPLCKWSIHILQERYEPAPSPAESESLEFDEATMRGWPTAWSEPSFDQRLQDNLENNDFSSIKASDLPIAIGSVAKAAQKSPKEIFEEALGFAIVARNPELVRDLLEKQIRENYDISYLHVCHLATTYLDGSKSCCQILELVEGYLGAKYRPYINQLGHTVLDNLMMTILKSHTSVLPEQVDDALKDNPRFSGEDVDICGRWDMDSPCYQRLVASGRSKVPSSWKHKFCHTSVQAICHCIEVLAQQHSIFNGPSGLFIKHCSSCGAKLQPLPLHAMVLTAFFLTKFGSEDEDLFGMVCCILCLLSYASEDTDVSGPAEISIILLQGGDGLSGMCSHRALSPAALAKDLTSLVQEMCNEKAKLAWLVICRILRGNEAGRRVRPPRRMQLRLDDEYDSGAEVGESSDENESCDGVEVEELHNEIFWAPENDGFELDCSHHIDYERPKMFGRSKILGPIWAAAQAELLTYRRVKEGDPWCSGRFDMRAVLSGLEHGLAPFMPLLDGLMLQPFCACGDFDRVFTKRLYREDATEFYFSNLEDWHRTAFIDDCLFNSW